MIALFNKVAIKLQAFRKSIYLIALLVIANIVYRLIFAPQAVTLDNSITMLNLLFLAWLALVNFMLHAFATCSDESPQKNSLLTRIKNKLNQWFEYFLAILFVGLSLTVIFLSIRMLKLYAA